MAAVFVLEPGAAALGASGLLLSQGAAGAQEAQAREEAVLAALR